MQRKRLRFSLFAAGAVVVASGFTSTDVLAVTQCNRGTPTNFFHHFGGPSNPDHLDIWINFADGGGPVSLNTDHVNANAVQLLITAAHSALNTGGRLLIRYQESGLTCPPAGVRNDITGFFVLPPVSGVADGGNDDVSQPPLDSGL